MKEYKIFLDDVRQPYDVFRTTILPIYENDSSWVIVRSYEDFVEVLEKNGVPDVVSFDHDLSFDHYLEENQKGDIDYSIMKEMTGYDAAKYLVEICIGKGVKLPMYYIHSANPVGSENIKSYLENAKKYL